MTITLAPKRKRRIISIIAMILAALTIMIAILAGMVYLVPNRHSLFIMNRTNSDVVITRILINGRRIDAGDIVLKPKKPKERSDDAGKKFKYGFRAAGDSVLVLDVKTTVGKETRLSCNLEDPNRAGCIFYANIRNDNELACFCDSYADFYD